VLCPCWAELLKLPHTASITILNEKRNILLHFFPFLCLVFNKGSLVSGIRGVKQEQSFQDKDKVIHAYMGIDSTRPKALVKTTIGTIKPIGKSV